MIGVAWTRHGGSSFSTRPSRPRSKALNRPGSDERFEKLDRGADAYAFRRLEFLASHRADLPCLGTGKACLVVAPAPVLVDFVEDPEFSPGRKNSGGNFLHRAGPREVREAHPAASFDHPVICRRISRVVFAIFANLRNEITVDTINPVEISFDPAKNEANVRKRGLPFTLVRDEFDWASAQVIEDTRRDYGEQRFFALGFVDRRLHAVVYTPRVGGIHVISLRKANRREERRYEAQAESRTG